MELYLSANSPRNAVLSGPDGQVLYTSSTPSKTFGTRTTTVTNKIGLLAQIEWHRKNHKLTAWGTVIDINSFLQKDNQNRVFWGPDGRQYRWNLGSDGMSSPVLETNDGSRTCIAKIHKRRYGIFGKHRPATLQIFDGGMRFLDHIVITFIFIEQLQKRRKDDEDEEEIFSTIFGP